MKITLIVDDDNDNNVPTTLVRCCTYIVVGKHNKHACSFTLTTDTDTDRPQTTSGECKKKQEKRLAKWLSAP